MTNSLWRKDEKKPLWRVFEGLTDYEPCFSAMRRLNDLIRDNKASEQIWLLEHPALYTAGLSAKPHDLLDHHRFPVYETDRGGQYTYHGPGQRVVYLMLDLKERKRDIRALVEALEWVIIDTLKEFGIRGHIRPGRVGVWIDGQQHNSHLTEDKIAALGIKVRSWVTFHGLSLNIAPDIEHFSGIVPCGQTEFGITSLKDLGLNCDFISVDRAFKRAFETRFGPVSETETHSRFEP
jgi:lipoyl(octanoyl) transferase